MICPMEKSCDGARLYDIYVASLLCCCLQAYEPGSCYAVILYSVENWKRYTHAECIELMALNSHYLCMRMLAGNPLVFVHILVRLWRFEGYCNRKVPDCRPIANVQKEAYIVYYVKIAYVVSIHVVCSFVCWLFCLFVCSGFFFPRSNSKQTIYKF